MYNIICISACVRIVPPADRRQQIVQHQWSGGAVFPEGQATGLSEAHPASQSDSYQLCAQAEGTWTWTQTQLRQEKANCRTITKIVCFSAFRNSYHSVKTSVNAPLYLQEPAASWGAGGRPCCPAAAAAGFIKPSISWNTQKRKTNITKSNREF